MVIFNESICCGYQTPSWLPSSPKGEIVGNMMQYVVLYGNLLMSSDVTVKGIPVSAREMKNIRCHNVYAGLMKETCVKMQCICHFYEGNPLIHSRSVYTQFL